MYLFHFLISFSFKTFVYFSLCVGLNWQFACQISSVSRSSYHRLS